MRFLRTAIAAAMLFSATAAYGQTAGRVTNHAFAIGKGPGVSGFTSLLCGSGQLAIGSATDPVCAALSGDATMSAAGVVALAASGVGAGGPTGSATVVPIITYDAKGRLTAVTSATIAPAIGSVSGLGAGCATFLGTPSSANLRGCMTDETGTGLLYFQGGALGTPASGDATNVVNLNASQLTAGTLPAARLNLGQLTNSLGANVALNNISNYFDGPSVAQGSTGTWFASGTVTAIDTAGPANIICKLWDGTTVISSAQGSVASINLNVAFALSGFITAPAGNIRISCKDPASTSGILFFNATGNSKDSTISVFRIN